ncbi:MAG: hypothetical protein ACHP7B_01830 [Burkholderiales bacterium]|jgi:hypothetical protein
MAARGKAPRKESPAASRAPQPEMHFTGPLPPRRMFLARFRRGAQYAFALVGVTLLIGMIGYRLLEGLTWLDAFHQSAMLLSGMGPVVDVKTTAGKLFDGIYALFCGVILLVSTGLLFAPLIHRILHRFHIEDRG